MFAPGDVVLGKYRIDRVLGEGGMGVVVLAQHTQLDQRVALKFMTMGAALEPEAAGRFQREARAVAKLRGENVARVLDVDALPDGTPFIVMEYLEGRDLSDVVAEHALPVPDAVDYVLQASVALAEAHAQGIVHRDLKPANLFLTHKPDGSPLIKVLDFGVSKLRSEDEPSALTTRTGAVMGSPLFMPPEQARSSKNVDHRADIWALGAVLYQLVGHRPPFHADNFADLFVKILHEQPDPLSTLNATIPPGLDAVINRCLAKQPEQRYENLGEMALALGPFASPDGARLVSSVLRLTGDPRATQPGAVRQVDLAPPAAAATTAGIGPVAVTAGIGPVAGAVSGVGGATQDALSVSATRTPSRTPLLLVLAAAGVVVVVALAFALRRPAQALDPSAVGSAPAQVPAASESAPSPSVAPVIESAAPAEPSAEAAMPAEPKREPESAPKPVPTREATARTEKTKPSPAAAPAKSGTSVQETPAAPAPPKPPAPPAAKPDPFGTMQ